MLNCHQFDSFFLSEGGEEEVEAHWFPPHPSTYYNSASNWIEIVMLFK